ncbi:MAG: DUF6513 domain-containing protein [Planctomycetaceae bacterium]
MPERILFVTGKLAEFSLRRVLESLSRRIGFEYEIAVLGISVAALMHADWVLRKLTVDSRFDRVILPGWCQGELTVLAERHQMSFQRGPKDLHDLDQYFGAERNPIADLSAYDIEILAEINHAPRMTDEEIVAMAERFRANGADLIDLGCIPGESWTRAGEVTKLLRDRGFRVSIDSFDRAEVEASVAAGAELVLSCNSTNLDWATSVDAEFVIIPDDPRGTAALDELDRTMESLANRGVRFRIDPVIEPIGFGFAASLARYFECRRRWPAVAMMMGIGNLTELTEVDSAGVNLLLAGICQELGVRSVLTTEVINWARSAVKELDAARRLVRHSISRNVLPKHVDSSLVMLRDARVQELSEEEIAHLATRIHDANFRVLLEGGELHLINRDGHWHGSDPYELFDRVLASSAEIDASHAFYLGYELSKAVTALTLGKQYTQDQPLRWGILTVPEESAVERRRKERMGSRQITDSSIDGPRP